MMYNIDSIVESFKLARGLTKKYGVSVLFLDELENKMKEIATENEWTPDWPTEHGWYWFYGHKYGEEKVSITVVRVRKVTDGVVRVIDGAFMYKGEKHRGVFQRISTPVIPAEIAGGDLLA